MDKKYMKRFQQKLTNKYPNENLIVLEYNGARSNCTIMCKNCGTVYKYKHSGCALEKRKKVLCHNCIDKIEKRKRFEQSLKDRFPQDILEVLEFTSRKEPVTIQCCVCGEKAHFNKGDYALQRTKYFCKKCHQPKYDFLQNHLKRFKKFIEEETDWILITDLSTVNYATELIDCECPVCHTISGKTMHDYERGRGCLTCAGTKLKTTEEFKQELDEDYEILDEYKNAYTKVTLRHKTCNFIYKTTPHNYLTGARCPQCMRKHSKGENKIQKFLDKYEIPYEQEYMVKIKGHNLRYDFYLPLQDLFIEFHGEQHYHPVEFFGGKARFIKQQEYDKLKEKDNVLYINYIDYDNIETILTEKLLSSTTIAKASTSQAIGDGKGELPKKVEDIV